MTESPQTRTTVVVPASQPMVAVLGARDELLRVVEQAFPTTDISVRGNEITVAGPPGEVALVERFYDELVTVLRTGQGVTAEAVERMVTMLRSETGERPAEVLTLNILSNRGRTIRPKTLNQKRYVDAIDRNTITFGIGPAGTIEVAPLAYMRGRSLNDAFIILDEAQNTSPEQMKMFLTRLGFGSKMVVTGDVTQVDLPGGTSSGLRVVQEILDHTQDVEFCLLSAQDVVRHRLVSDIVEAYGRWDEIQQDAGSRRSQGGSNRRRR
jgi:phosphate starvation-inducible protein PhoH